MKIRNQKAYSAENKMNNRHSRTDGENKTVEGDMVEFQNSTEGSLEQRIDILEDTKVAVNNTDSAEIPQLDLKRLYGAYHSVREIFQYMELDKDMDVKSQKSAVKNIGLMKDLYARLCETINDSREEILEIKESLEKYIDNNNPAKSRNIDIPRNIYQHTVEDLSRNIININQTVSGFNPSDEEVPEITMTVKRIGDILKDTYNSRNLTQVFITLDFIAKQYTKLGKSFPESTEITLRHWENLINRTPDDAITVRYVQPHCNEILIQVIDPAPITPPRNQKKNWLIQDIYNSIKAHLT
jgi:hypothetical protein